MQIGKNSCVVVRHCRRETTMFPPSLPPFSCDELRSYIERKEDAYLSAILLLDCRSFLTFNESHIESAVNAYCPSILRRRSRGKLPFHVLIPSSDVRDKIMKGHYSIVVLYEENTPVSFVGSGGPGGTGTVGVSGGTVATDDHSAIRVVSRCLQQESGLRNIFYLDGGFQRFSKKYAHLCVGSQVRPIVAPSSPLSSGPYSPTVMTSSSSSISSNGPLKVSQQSSNPVYEQGDPVEILPHLFLGSAFHAANLKTLEKLGVTALLNVSRSCPNLSEGRFAYKSIPVDDSNSADISTWFNEAIEFIDDVKMAGGKVLVHCYAGISRSATICLAYLMFSRRIRLDEAYEYVKTRRSIISPNFNFMGQLLKFESQLLLSPTTIRGNCGVKSGTGRYVSVVSRDSCLVSPRFVFDLGVLEDDNCYRHSQVTSSSPLISPLCTAATPIMSPS